MVGGPTRCCGYKLVDDFTHMKAGAHMWNAFFVNIGAKGLFDGHVWRMFAVASKKHGDGILLRNKFWE